MAEGRGQGKTAARNLIGEGSQKGLEASFTASNSCGRSR